MPGKRPAETVNDFRVVCRMLVLTRHKDESIFLGDDIEITVVALCSGEVRLGIRAPLSLPVRRKEVYERIRKKERQRLSSDTGA